MSFVPDRATVSRRAEQGTAGRARFVATGQQTRGDFGLFEMTMPPGGGGPGPHYHRTFSESFYVVEGRLAVLSGDEWVTLEAGELGYVPRSGVHGFRSTDEHTGARFLILFTPGAPREAYFGGLAAMYAGGRTPTNEEIDAFAAQHDQVNLRE